MLINFSTKDTDFVINAIINFKLHGLKCSRQVQQTLHYDNPHILNKKISRASFVSLPVNKIIGKYATHFVGEYVMNGCWKDKSVILLYIIRSAKKVNKVDTNNLRSSKKHLLSALKKRKLLKVKGCYNKSIHVL